MENIGRIADIFRQERIAARKTHTETLERLEKEHKELIYSSLKKEFYKVVERHVPPYAEVAGWTKEELALKLMTLFSENIDKIAAACDDDADLLPELRFVICFPGGMVPIMRQISDLVDNIDLTREHRDLLTNIASDTSTKPQILVGVKVLPMAVTAKDTKLVNSNEELVAIARSCPAAYAGDKLWLGKLGEDSVILSFGKDSKRVERIDHHGAQHAINRMPLGATYSLTFK